MIPDDDQRVAVQRRCAAFAELASHALVAQIDLPDGVAVEVVRVVAAGLEGRNDVLAVDDGGRGRPGPVFSMRGLVRRLLARDAVPHGLARLAIERDHHIAMRNARLRAARRVLRGALDADRYGAGHEYAVAPDDRRSRAAAGELHLPSDVLRVAPFDGRLRGARNTGALRPAPLRPEPVGRRLPYPGL